MNRYKSLHLWMIPVLVITQLSIFNYYWPTFASEHWEIHIHYWLVTFWYVLVVTQPYFATHGKLEKHRTWGILGFVVAGGAIFTGFSLLDMPLKLAENFDSVAGPPSASFYYAVLIAEMLEMVAFSIAIWKGIVHRKNLENHSWWLIASSIYMIAPALGRGLIIFWRSVLPPDAFFPLFVFGSIELIYIPLLLVFAKKFGKINHPATWLGLSLVIVRILSRPLAASEAVQRFLDALIVW